MSPYREAVATEVLEAPTRDGTARLEVAPRHVKLTVGDRTQLTITERAVSIITGDKRRKRKSLALAEHRLIMARGVPSAEIGLWYEKRPGVVWRIFGIRPVELLDADAMEAWRALDRLADRLREALAPRAEDVYSAEEIGHGADRVLVTDHGDRLEFFVRRLFRERQRRALEVRTDGTVVIPGRRGAQVRCPSRFAVTVLGDYIRFADRTGTDVASVSVPWVSAEDRKALAQRIANTVDRAALASGRGPS